MRGAGLERCAELEIFPSSSLNVAKSPFFRFTVSASLSLVNILLSLLPFHLKIKNFAVESLSRRTKVMKLFSSSASRSIALKANRGPKRKLKLNVFAKSQISSDCRIRWGCMSGVNKSIRLSLPLPPLVRVSWLMRARSCDELT